VCKKTELVGALRARITDDGFKNRHRLAAKRFERERKLPFVLIMLLILRKSAKALQTMLNEIRVARHSQQRRQFVIRCSKGAFQAARDLCQADQIASRRVTLWAPQKARQALQAAHLPHSVPVRFVALRLETGALEVLVTSLLDEQRFPTLDFKAIDNLRWGVETLYDVLKTRLALENFSGKTATAVRQEFHATIFLTGLESWLTAEADDKLATRSAHNQLGQTVKNMVSFAAIKQHALALLLTEPNPMHLLERLTDLFLLNPTYTRPYRKPPRRRIQDRAALHFWRYRRKVCF
jgi:hypothetical protein